MTRWDRLTNHATHAGALCDVLPWFGFVDDGVFLNKTGSLGIVLAIDGIEYDCLDQPAREHIIARVDAALRLWDEHAHIYQYVLKRPVTLETEAFTGDAKVDHLLALRRGNRGSQAAQRFQLSLYLVVVVDAPRQVPDRLQHLRDSLRHPLAAVRRSLSTQTTVVNFDEALAARVAQLRHRGHAFVQQLQDVAATRALNAEDAWRVLRRLVNDTRRVDAPSLRADARLDVDTADTAIECHRDHLRLGDDYVRVLTLKTPPAQTRALLLQALAEIPSSMVICSEWQREGEGRIRREINARRRHFHNARVSVTSYLSDQNAQADLLVDDSAAAVVRDLGAALTELSLQGRYFGIYTLTIVLSDKDPQALERSVAAVLKAVATHDAQVTDERYNLLHAWLAVLPGNSHYNLRGMYLLNTNAADLALLFAPGEGDHRNAHLGREALATVDTPLGTPYHLNLHVGDVGHTLVLGATGAGKSFLVNALLAQLQRYEPRMLIFDLGGSYRSLTRYFEGRELQLRPDRQTVTINPFCLDPTPANLQFLCAFVRVLIESSGEALARGDDQALYEAIETLYILDREQRRLFTLANILPRRLSHALQRWVEGGQHAAFFDNVADTVTLAPFQLVDFEGLDAVPSLLEPLLFYLLHRASAALLDSAEAGRLKVFAIDEAWRFLRNPTIRAYVTEALKTWRKKNAMVILATQSGEDLQHSELLRVAVESCPTRIFLANPHIDRKVYQDLFGLNPREAERITSLVPRQEFLLKQTGTARVLRLDVDPESAAIFGGARA